MAQMPRLSKDTRDLYENLSEDGWTYERPANGQHLLIAHPTGARLTIPQNMPGDPRARRNYIRSAKLSIATATQRQASSGQAG